MALYRVTREERKHEMKAETEKNVCPLLVCFVSVEDEDVSKASQKIHFFKEEFSGKERGDNPRFLWGRSKQMGVARVKTLAFKGARNLWMGRLEKRRLQAQISQNKKLE